MLKKTMLLAMVSLYLSSSCQAAVSDSGIGEYYKKEQELYQEKTLPDQETVVDNTEKDKENSQQDTVSIYVSKINVGKSEILTEQEIQALIEKYEGREHGIKDLYSLVKEINELYKKKSYITAKAILPPQKIQDGVVKIQLVEGRFGEFLVEGNKYTNSFYIKDRITLNSGDLVNLEQLQKDIFFFNNTNDLGMRAELKPGKKVGTTDCILRLKEPDSWQATIFSDNAGRSESGLYRIGMVIANNSLAGNRESLVISPTWTKGTMSGSLAYSVPVDNFGTRVGVGYSKNQSNIISGPYETMDIQSDSTDVSLVISQPLLVEAKHKLDGYAEIHWKDADTDFSGQNQLYSKTKTATFGVNSRTIDNKGVWYNQGSITGISATQKDAYQGRKFMRINLSTIRQQVLANDRTLLWRLSGQLTDTYELPSTEKFSLGGMSSVKGYKEGLLIGDQGYYAGVEYNFPLKADDKKLKGLIFVDHGRTYNSFNTGISSQEYLTSAGIGFVYNPTQNLFGKIVVGFPISSTKEHDKARIHFFIQTAIK